MRTLVGDIDARILPKLYFWFRAETHRLNFTDGGGATYAFDESSNGNNLYNSSTPPLFVADACNGYAAFNFTGALWLLGNMVFTGVVAGAYAVVKHNVAGNWGAGSEGILTDYGSTVGQLTGKANASQVHKATVTDTTYVNGTATQDIANTDAWNLLYVEFTVTANRTFTGTAMGRQGGGATYLNGQIAEAGYFGAIPTAATRTLFFNSLIEKYAITGTP